MEVYRLILFGEGGLFQTGATYSGCSLANTDGCKPMSFATLQDAVDYANEHEEIPVLVQNENDAWAIVDGRKPITDDMLVNNTEGFSVDPITLGAIAVGAIFVLPKLLRRKSA